MSLSDTLANLPWATVALGCVTLGLAPFTPPHIVEKLGMLFAGKLVKPIDWFDLFFHGAPWGLAIAKAAVMATRGTTAG
jgi:hypothetical protein